MNITRAIYITQRHIHVTLVICKKVEIYVHN